MFGKHHLLERRGFWSTSTDQRLKKRPNCAIAPPQAPIFLISCFHGLRDKEYTSPFYAPAPALPYCFKCLSPVYYSKSLNMCSMSQANTRRHNADVITDTLNTGTHGDNINLDYKKFDLWKSLLFIFHMRFEEHETMEWDKINTLTLNLTLVISLTLTLTLAFVTLLGNLETIKIGN